MIKAGIDAMSFYTPHCYLDLGVLAEARGAGSDKYRNGLGQEKMAVVPPDEDVITLAADAGNRVLNNSDRQEIELLLFATESGIDQSKAGGIYVHRLLGLSPRCRIVELKQACYSATVGLQMALSWLREHPDKKALLIASDIAKYGLNTKGESSQGAAAVAMILSTHPRMIEIEPECGFYTEDVMDFWRPNYCEEAIVEGQYSCELYLSLLQKTWEQYRLLSHRSYSDHAQFCYHVPVPKLVEKAHQYLLKINNLPRLEQAALGNTLRPVLDYGRVVGNCYTAALYLSLISLLENSQNDLSQKRIGFYSYGSGCVGEFFSGIVQPQYHTVLDKDYHQKMLKNRQALTLAEYEHFYNFRCPEDGSNLTIQNYKMGHARLAGMSAHKRLYETMAN